MPDVWLIDANVLTRWLEMVLSNANPLDRKARADFSEVLARVETMPDVDAVPVVRCSRCKHYEDDCGYCGYWETSRRVDDYCSRGEKRDVVGAS